MKSVKKSEFEVTLTYHFKCGMFINKEVALTALQNMEASVPIRAEADVLHGGRTIGRTTSKPYDIVWEEDTHTWRFKVDGLLFYGGTGIATNRVQHNGIGQYLDEATITSIVITADGIGLGNIMDYE